MGSGKQQPLQHALQLNSLLAGWKNGRSKSWGMNLSEVEIPFRPIQPPKVNWVFFLLLISAFFKFRRTRHLLSHHSPCHTMSGQYGPVPCSVNYPFPTSRHCHILFVPNSCSTCLRSRIHVWSLWQGQLFFIKTNEEENNFSSYFWCSLLIFISADQLIGVWEEKPLLCFFASVTEHTYSISMQSRKRINLHLEGSFLSEDHNSDEYFCKLKKRLECLIYEETIIAGVYNKAL